MAISVKLKKLKKVNKAKKSDLATTEVKNNEKNNDRQLENFDDPSLARKEKARIDNAYEDLATSEESSFNQDVKITRSENLVENLKIKDSNKPNSWLDDQPVTQNQSDLDLYKNKTPLIKLEKLEKYYLVGGQKQMVIKGIDLEIYPGETVAILGKSGSGKSTLLNILGLLDAPTGGTYSLNGYNVNSLSGNFLATTRARTFGFIFQQFNLLPKLTVLENVIMPIRYTRDPDKWAKRFETAHNLLKMVEIEEQAQKLPKLLSGGQQQRVAIARSLVNQPKVIIGDEPTGALDSKTAKQIVKQIFELNRELGVTVIIVTHDEDLAYKCGRVIRLVDGLIVDEDTPLESLD